MEELTRRVGQCESDIKTLSKEVTENTTNMGYIQKVVDDFSEFIKENIKTLTNIQNELMNLNKNQENFEKKLCEVKAKVDENENLNKIDLRVTQKKNYENILTKIGLILTPIAMLGFILYLLFGQ